MNIRTKYCLYFPYSSPTKIVVCGNQLPSYCPSNHALLEDASISIKAGILYLSGKRVQEDFIPEGRFITTAEIERYEPGEVVYKKRLFTRRVCPYLKVGWRTLKERKDFLVILSTSTWQVVINENFLNIMREDQRKSIFSWRKDE